MNIEIVREYCLAKLNVEEVFPFGPETLVMKVDGKIFLLTGLDEVEFCFNVKCDPDIAIKLREEFSCVLPGYHMNKKHWNTIIVDGTVNADQIKEWIDHSYELVKSKKKKTKP